jgi:hypothetical protein
VAISANAIRKRPPGINLPSAVASGYPKPQSLNGRGFFCFYFYFYLNDGGDGRSHDHLRLGGHELSSRSELRHPRSGCRGAIEGPPPHNQHPPREVLASNPNDCRTRGAFALALALTGNWQPTTAPKPSNTRAH